MAFLTKGAEGITNFLRFTVKLQNFFYVFVSFSLFSGLFRFSTIFYHMFCVFLCFVIFLVIFFGDFFSA